MHWCVCWLLCYPSSRTHNLPPVSTWITMALFRMIGKVDSIFSSLLFFALILLFFPWPIKRCNLGCNPCPCLWVITSSWRQPSNCKHFCEITPDHHLKWWSVEFFKGKNILITCVCMEQVYRTFLPTHSFGIYPMTSGRALHINPHANLSSTSETAIQMPAESKVSANF